MVDTEGISSFSFHTSFWEWLAVFLYEINPLQLSVFALPSYLFVSPVQLENSIPLDTQLTPVTGYLIQSRPMRLTSAPLISFQQFLSKEWIVLTVKKICVSGSFLKYKDKPETAWYCLLPSLSLKFSNMLSNQIVFCISLISCISLILWRFGRSVLLFCLSIFVYSNSFHCILQINLLQSMSYVFSDWLLAFNHGGNKRIIHFLTVNNIGTICPQWNFLWLLEVFYLPYESYVWAWLGDCLRWKPEGRDRPEISLPHVLIFQDHS